MIYNVLSTQGFDKVLEAPTASAAVSIFNSHPIDVAILDLHLGAGPTGIDVAQAMRRKSPSVGIVFLTSFDDPRLLSPSLPDLPGNSQYLVKSKVSDVGLLLSAINAAAGGSNKQIMPKPTNLLVELSDTQLSLLHLLSEGLSNAEIAKRRFVTERTVEVSLTRIAKQLGMAPDTSRNQRVHMAKVYFRSRGTHSLGA
jgi:DNA-binding NarL/FixJ family response regulator